MLIFSVILYPTTLLYLLRSGSVTLWGHQTGFKTIYLYIYCDLILHVSALLVITKCDGWTQMCLTEKSRTTKVKPRVQIQSVHGSNEVYITGNGKKRW